jgi:tRNA pseudouridine38-40 synthase
MRIKLVVAYDGTEFCGWAPQAGRRTVQSTLREAVRLISGEEIEITGASRTDSGAHAKGQVCHFDTKSPMPASKWVPVLNKRLPPDLSAVRATQVNEQFHSRFSAQDRFYRYRVLTGERDPMRTRFAHSYGRPLDTNAMQVAANALVGEHDFRAYTEELDEHVTNTCRELFSFQVRQVRDEVWVDVVGTAFLRGMMRRMAGALLEVGRGHRHVAEVSRLLDPEERNRLQWPVVLPANGLCLMRVRYGRKPRDSRTLTASDELPGH